MLLTTCHFITDKDNLTIGLGARNVFDKEPPMVDPSEIDSKSNAPLGYGYSLLEEVISLTFNMIFNQSNHKEHIFNVLFFFVEYKNETLNYFYLFFYNKYFC